MACTLFGAMPLFEPMLPCCQLHPKENLSVKFHLKTQNFSFKKMHLTMSSAKWRPFVSASMCYMMRATFHHHSYQAHLLILLWNSKTNETLRLINQPILSAVDWNLTWWWMLGLSLVRNYPKYSSICISVHQDDSFHEVSCFFTGTQYSWNATRSESPLLKYLFKPTFEARAWMRQHSYINYKM